MLPLRLRERVPEKEEPAFNSIGIEGLEIVVCTKVEGEKFSPRVLQPGFRRMGDTSSEVIFPGRIKGDQLLDYECADSQSRRVQEFVMDINPPLAPRADHLLWTPDGVNWHYGQRDGVKNTIDELSVLYSYRALSEFSHSSENALSYARRSVNARETNLNAWAVLIALTEIPAGKEDTFFRKIHTKNLTAPDTEYLLGKISEVKEYLKG